jgi:hypothetical protein
MGWIGWRAELKRVLEQLFNGIPELVGQYPKPIENYFKMDASFLKLGLPRSPTSDSLNGP